MAIDVSSIHFLNKLQSLDLNEVSVNRIIELVDKIKRNDETDSKLVEIFSNPNINDNTLFLLSKTGINSIRYYIAKNPSLSNNTAEYIICCNDKDILLQISKNETISPNNQELLYKRASYFFESISFKNEIIYNITTYNKD